MMGSEQAAASHPSVSAWVAASAGTGKTTVLSSRVLRLLLAGSAPQRLLCLTFTKAAAAEMENRIMRRLSAWATMADEALSADLYALAGGERYPTPDEAVRARRLFARVLDTAGGMKIMTIHAFCQSVLGRFPLEADIPPEFEVLDDRSAAELLAEALAQTYAAARAEPEGDLAKALAIVTANTHEAGFADLIDALIRDRGRFAGMVEAAGGIGAYTHRVSRQLGLGAADTPARVLAGLVADGAFDATALREAARLLQRASAVTDRRAGAALAGWLDLPDAAARAGAFSAWTGIFLTQEYTPRANPVTKGFSAAYPGVAAAIQTEQARILAGRTRLRTAEIAAASAGLARLGSDFLDRYRGLKAERSLLDYEDLILGTRDLLQRPGVAPWVLYKLDGGIEHLLIDEAQDTNPDQWRIVELLAEEFFAGAGAGSVNRTVFAVGDAKQSIFSFQRADPDSFHAMHDHFARRVVAASADWRSAALHVSFRSGPAVLDLVDQVFALPEARPGVVADGETMRHAPSRATAPGVVEFWPVLQPRVEGPEAAWTLPLEQGARDEPRARLARRLARTIKGWLDRAEPLLSRNRPIRPGDIMVLVRRRGAFVADLTRALKGLGVAVAGRDRMVLTRQIAVMDLLALGRFLLLPEDDLNLAALLKSPLFGLDEDQLFSLAQGRPGTLWQVLGQHPARWARDAASALADLMARADFVRPYELFADILGRGGAKQRLVGRLGPEAADAIDEFLAQSLLYERQHVPSLQGFLAWIEQGETEIKRDLDQGGRDEVRIMTVHGAKGLQAPIVILPDTVAVPQPAQLSPLLWPKDSGIMLWAPGGGADEPVSAAAQNAAAKRQEDEYRRLFYVALTRAEDRLLVCGWAGKRAASEGNWHQLVGTAMLQLGAAALRLDDLDGEASPLAAGERDGLVRVCPGQPDKPDTAPAAAGERPLPLPGYFAHPPAPEPAPPRPLVASRPAATDPSALSPLMARSDERRFQRGLLIHRLLQTLPDLPVAARAAAASRFLALPAHGLAPDQQLLLAEETLAVLDHAEFAPLFGPTSRAEVPIVGLVDGYALSGRVDRLVVTPTDILIVDYKTNRPPPVHESEVAPAYVAQLAAYRAALQRIYPDRPVRTLLLWTDGPRLMEVRTGA